MRIWSANLPGSSLISGTRLLHPQAIEALVGGNGIGDRLWVPIAQNGTQLLPARISKGVFVLNKVGPACKGDVPEVRLSTVIFVRVQSGVTLVMKEPFP